MKTILTLMTVAAVGLGSCGSVHQGSQSQVAQVRQVPSNHCEVFVDKIATTWGARSQYGFRVFIKTINDRLNGRVVAAGFLGRVLDRDNSCGQGRLEDCDKVGKWQDTYARPFFGAENYFELWLEVAHDGTFRHTHEGWFWVQTAQGTRYMARTFPSGGQDNPAIFLDANGYNLLSGKLRAYGISEHNTDVSRLPTTADFYDYLNPHRCR